MIKKNLYVLDSNIPEYDPLCLSQFEEHDVLLPISSVLNLSSGRRDAKRENIKEFFNELEAIKGDKMLNASGVLIGPSKGNLFVLEHPTQSPVIYKTFSKETVAGKILGLLHYLTFYSQYSKINSKASKQNRIANSKLPFNPEMYGKVVLVTRDPSLRAAAAMFEMHAEPYRSDRIDKLYSGVKYIEEPSLQSLFYDENQSELLSTINPLDLVANRYFTVLDPTGAYEKKQMSETFAWQFKLPQKVFIPVTPKQYHAVCNIKPRNVEQRLLLAAASDPSIAYLVAEGPAGTGKTLMLLAAGLELVSNNQYKRVLITRNSIGVGNSEQGFYPGSPEEKTMPFLRGFYDNMEVINDAMKDPKYCSTLMEKGFLKPIEFENLRGRTFNGDFVIVDETQNLDKHELKTVATRLGENSKMVFTGDITQIDDPNLGPFDNGLSIFTDKLKGQSIFAHVKLEKAERSTAAGIVNKLF